MAATPKASWPWVKTLLHSVYDQPDAASVHAQYDRLADAVQDKLPDVAAHLEAPRPDVLAFTAVPQELWRQIWSNNPQGAAQPGDPPTHRRGRHLPRPQLPHPPGRRRPGRAARRMAEGRRYLGLDLLARSRVILVPGTVREVHTSDPPALSA